MVNRVTCRLLRSKVLLPYEISGVAKGVGKIAFAGGAN
jgi:hypothetical protein